MIACADLAASGIERARFRPVQIDTQYRPEILLAGYLRFDEAVTYMDDASSMVEHRFEIDGDEIVVS